MTVISPLDIETIFLSFVAGSPFIFWVLGIILMIFVAGKFRMPVGTILIFGFIFTFVSITTLETEGARMIAFIALVLLSLAAAYIMRGPITRS